VRTCAELRKNSAGNEGKKKLAGLFRRGLEGRGPHSFRKQVYITWRAFLAGKEGHRMRGRWGEIAGRGDLRGGERTFAIPLRVPVLPSSIGRGGEERKRTILGGS